MARTDLDELVEDHLRDALEEADHAEKDYHIRTALQALVTDERTAGD